MTILSLSGTIKAKRKLKWRHWLTNTALIANQRLLVFAVLIVAAFFRLWNLTAVPPSASMDEASIGYNAYAVLKTGVDEYGELPNMFLRSYDDWRRALFFYLVIPFVALFDLSVLAVRLPAAILSILTVLATYHIVLMVFQKNTAFSKYAALLAAFLLAISPWHVYISRLGHESNANLSFLVFAILFFLVAQRKGKIALLFLSMLFFVLSMISYNSGQAFVPIFVAGLFLIYRKSLWQMVTSEKKIAIALTAFILLTVPIVWMLFQPTALVRFEATNTFKPEAHQELFDKRITLRNKAFEERNIVGMILYNQRLFPVQVFLEGYLSHYRPSWLLTNSGFESHKVPNMGLLYSWVLLFFVVGVFVLFRNHTVDKKARLLLLLWFILGPLPAALATQAPHAMRSYNFVPVWQLIAAFGLVYVVRVVQSFRVLKLFMIGVLTIASLLSISALYRNYFLVFPKEQSKSFHYALSKAIPYVLEHKEEYKKIIFSNKENLYQSYMLFLFYSRYDPALYQRLGGTRSGGFAETHAFDKYEFRPVDFSKETFEEGMLFVVNISEAEDILPVKTFAQLDGEEAIALVRK